ncbi:MAG: SGNH/GDSL hydrolase family protein [Prevotellaceae bacterium]|nr:SGNH/GDSL hydrolase family protein [Candidatus Minthosoma caballi]
MRLSKQIEKLAIRLTTIMLPLLTIACQLNAEETPDTMNVAILGDSNTWLGGDNCNQPKGWNTWFVKNFNPQSCQSYARSGATWTNTTSTFLNTEENVGVLTDNNVIYNQVMRLHQAVSDGLQPEPHLIIIAAGTNDAWFEAKRPAAFSTEGNLFDASPSDICAMLPNRVLTLQSAVIHNCRLLQSHYPNARIVLLTPLQTTAVSLAKIQQTGDLIEDCGKHLGLCVIRQDRDCVVNREQETRKRTNTYDGTHTNENGAKQNGKIIADKIKQLINKTNCSL